MKYILVLLAVVIVFGQSFGQNLNKSIDVRSAKLISITSDYPSVEVHTTEGNEVIIEGHIYGNGIPLDDVVSVNWNSSTAQLSFVTDIELAKEKTKGIDPENLDDLSRDELIKIAKSRRGASHVKGHNYYDNNWNLETHIVIYLPKSITKVEADMEYGAYEMDHAAKEVKIYNKYGAIDVEVAGKLSVCDLESTYSTVTLNTSNNEPTDFRLQSNYGEIFTDLDLKVDRGASTHQSFKTIIVGTYKDGGDQSISMRSDYSNVYLRKL